MIWLKTFCFAELPTCRYIRQVKACWAKECAMRAQDTPASKYVTVDQLFFY